jgi:hypothetical protein
MKFIKLYNKDNIPLIYNIKKKSNNPLFSVKRANNR